jgi:hypothetical protein
LPGAASRARNLSLVPLSFPFLGFNADPGWRWPSVVALL